MGGILTDFDVNYCLYTSCVFSVAGILFSFTCLEEVFQQSTDPTVVSLLQLIRVGNPIPGIKRFFSNKDLRCLSICVILNDFNTMGVASIFFLSMKRFRLNATSVSLVISAFALSTVVVQGLLLKRIVPKIWSAEKASVYSLFFSAVQSAAIGVVPVHSPELLYAAAVLFCLSSIFKPVFQGIIVSTAIKSKEAYQDSSDLKPGDQGNLQGILNSLQALSSALGALFFGAIYSQTLTYSSSVSFPFILASLCYLFLCVYAHWVFGAVSSGTTTTATTSS